MIEEREINVVMGAYFNEIYKIKGALRWIYMKI